MSFKSKASYFFRNISEKHRVSVQNPHNDQEQWYILISPLNIVTGFLGLVLLLFIVISVTVAYTPLLDLIPGYPGNKSREMLIENILRLDSLENELTNWNDYRANIRMIVEGAAPVAQGDLPDTALQKGHAVGRIAEDSILRLQIELDEMYKLNTRPEGAQKVVKGGLSLFVPTQGRITQHFNPKEGLMGVGLEVPTTQPVMAVQEGTVVYVGWNPGDGFVLAIQHPNNTISVYKHNSQLIKKTGDRVKTGEIVAYTGVDRSSRETLGKNQFQFELWYNGTPLDPENYIVF